MRRLLVWTLLGAAACNISSSSGGDDALGSERIERFLERDLPQEGAPKINVTAVECPRRVERGGTATFTCSITVDDGAATVRVDQKGDRLSRRDAVLVVATLETFVQQQYEVQLGVGVVAECSPDALVAAEPGSAVECTATDAEGTTQTAQLMVEDLDGNVTLDLTPE